MLWQGIAHSACKSCDCAGSQWVTGRPPSCPKRQGLPGHLEDEAIHVVAWLIYQFIDTGVNELDLFCNSVSCIDPVSPIWKI